MERWWTALQGDYYANPDAAALGAEAFAGQNDDMSFWRDRVPAAFNATFLRDTVGWWAWDTITLEWAKRDDSSPTLTAVDANARYGLPEAYGVKGLQFDAPITQAAAEKMRKRKLDEQKWSRLQSLGDPGFFTQAAAGMVGGLAAGLLDPIEMPLSWIPLTAWAGRAAQTYRSANTLAHAVEAGTAAARGSSARALAASFMTKTETVRRGAGHGFVDNAATSLLLEPARWGLAQDWQADYDAADIPLRILQGAALGAVVGGGVAAMRGLSGAAARWRSDRVAKAAGDPVRAQAEDVGRQLHAIDQLADGRRVDVAPDVAAERAALGDAYDTVLRNPRGPANDPLVEIKPQDIDGLIVERGGFNKLNELALKTNSGIVKFIFKHGERSKEKIEYQLTRDDVIAFPDVIRNFAPIEDAVHQRGRTWRVDLPGPDGALRTVVFGEVMRKEDGVRSMVTAFVVNPERDPNEVKRPKSAPLSPAESRSEVSRPIADTGDTLRNNGPQSAGDASSMAPPSSAVKAATLDDQGAAMAAWLDRQATGDPAARSALADAAAADAAAARLRDAGPRLSADDAVAAQQLTDDLAALDDALANRGALDADVHLSVIAENDGGADANNKAPALYEELTNKQVQNIIKKRAEDWYIAFINGINDVAARANEMSSYDSVSKNENIRSAIVDFDNRSREYVKELIERNPNKIDMVLEVKRKSTDFIRNMISEQSKESIYIMLINGVIRDGDKSSQASAVRSAFKQDAKEYFNEISDGKSSDEIIELKNIGYINVYKKFITEKYDAKMNFIRSIVESSESSEEISRISAGSVHEGKNLFYSTQDTPVALAAMRAQNGKKENALSIVEQVLAWKKASKSLGGVKFYADIGGQNIRQSIDAVAINVDHYIDTDNSLKRDDKWTYESIKKTSRHEMLHFMKRYFTNEEWSYLEDISKNKWVDEYNVEKRWSKNYSKYRSMPFYRKMLLEEGIADAFAHHVRRVARNENNIDSFAIDSKASSMFDKVLLAFAEIGDIIRRSLDFLKLSLTGGEVDGVYAMAMADSIVSGATAPDAASPGARERWHDLFDALDSGEIARRQNQDRAAIAASPHPPKPLAAPPPAPDVSVSEIALRLSACGG